MPLAFIVNFIKKPLEMMQSNIKKKNSSVGVLIIGIIFTGNIRLCLSRTCTVSAALTDSGTHKTCNYTQFWVKNDYSQIKTTITPYLTEEKVLIIGVNHHTTTEILVAENLFPLGANAVDSTMLSVLAEGMEFTAGGVGLAIERFCRQNDPGYHFVIVYINDGCDTDRGGPNLVEMIDSGVDAILGIPCSGPVNMAGLLAAQFLIPMLSYSASSELLSNKKQFSTLIRVGATLKQFGPAFVEICSTYHWINVALLTSESGTCKEAGDLLRSTLTLSSAVKVVSYYKVKGPTAITDEVILARLKDFRENARVLAVCLPMADLTRLIKIADSEGMTSDEYVYFTFVFYSTDEIKRPWGSTDGLSESEVEKLKEAFSRLKMLVVSNPTSSDEMAIMQEISRRIAGPPWNIQNYDELGLPDTQSPFGLYMFDATWLYLTILEELNDEGLNVRSGKLFFERSRNRFFKGEHGSIINMDNDADKILVYDMWHFPPYEDEFSSFGTVRLFENDNEKVEGQNAYWGTNNRSPPPNEPACGYRGEKCAARVRNTALITSFAVITVLGLSAFLGIKVYRKWRFEQDLVKKTWKISCVDIVFAQEDRITTTFNSLKSGGYGVSKSNKDWSTKGAWYKGQHCLLRKIVKTDTTLNRADLMQLKRVKDLKHENLNPFVGACIDDPVIYILTCFYPKGSLKEALENEEINLDWTFKFSLITDLINGIHYIHNNTPLKVHGNLRSSACVIDNKWTLRIGLVGLNTLRYNNVVVKTYEEQKVYRELWRAPELLRLNLRYRGTAGTPKGDIYSFAIILQEILFRALPYFMKPDRLKEDAKDIVKKVKKGDPPYRPDIHDRVRDINKNMLILMTDCWKEDPDKRPDSISVKRRVAKINKTNRKLDSNYSILHKLEQYGVNLEEIDEKRNDELLAEKEKTDFLMDELLPLSIAVQLKSQKPVIAEAYDDVAIHISNIADFAVICMDSEPIEIVAALNEYCNTFDSIMQNFSVFRVESFRDSHMIISGCPDRYGDEFARAAEIARMSKELTADLKEFKIAEVRKPLQIRTGLHIGHCVAAVVGLVAPRFLVFGNAVNAVNQLEAAGEAGKINISEDFHKALSKSKEFEFRDHEDIIIVGMGRCKTFWLKHS